MAHEPFVEYLLAIVNFILCIGVSLVCGCRLRLMSSRTRAGVRLKYTVLGGAAVVHAVSPWVGEWPGWTGLCVSAAVLIGMLTSWHRWRHHAPEETRSDRASLHS